VVGAANSAGQAVLNLARFAKRVVMVVRGDSLDASMSRYLVDRIQATPNVEVRLRSEVTSCRGDGHLERLVIRDRDTGVNDDLPASWLFIFIGAAPRTDWLGDEVTRDERGFVVTGPELTVPPHEHWGLPRPPSPWRPVFPGSSRPATSGSTR
jgi:thioredoxin reductase (NADPH)